MRDATSENELLAPDLLEKLVLLHEHINAHERNVADLEYDPVESPKLMEPLQIKGAFSPTSLDDELLFDLFNGMSEIPEEAISGHFRVYIDGMLSPKSENEVLYTKPLPLERFESYICRAVNSERFGVIINGAEKWSDTLARFAVKAFAPIVEITGPERSTIEITLFIGNYGYTPFGIHIDDPYTSVVHLHAGPNTKQMTLFNREEFRRLNGTANNCFEPKRLIPYGHTFTIEAGDIFLLPPHYFHIGNTDNFSIGLAFALSKYTKFSTSRQILQSAFDDPLTAAPLHDLLTGKNDSDEHLSDWLQRACAKHSAQINSRRNLRYSFKRSSNPEILPNRLWIRDTDFPLTRTEGGGA